MISSNNPHTMSLSQKIANFTEQLAKNTLIMTIFMLGHGSLTRYAGWDAIQVFVMYWNFAHQMV